MVVETRAALRVRETSHPPAYHLPRAAFSPGCLEPADGTTWCEFKGVARYVDVVAGGRRAGRAGWHHPDPSPVTSS